MLIEENRGKKLGFKMESLKESLRKLKEKLIEDIALTPHSKRFAETINRWDIYKIIAARLQALRKEETDAAMN